MTAIDATHCPICGELNRCAMEIEKTTGVKQEACWCVNMSFSEALMAQVPKALQGQACICAKCASSGTHSNPADKMPS
jgi:hypothetical protein